MKTEEFLKIVDEHNNGKSYGLCPQPFPADKGLDILIEHFLGKDWYTTLPMSSEQVYTEAIANILDKTQPKSFFFKVVRFLILALTIGCMRRFACRIFQISTKTDSKLSYTPCYMQCGFNQQTLIRVMNLFVLFLYVGNLKMKYLYIINKNKLI